MRILDLSSELAKDQPEVDMLDQSQIGGITVHSPNPLITLFIEDSLRDAIDPRGKIHLKITTRGIRIRPRRSIRNQRIISLWD